MYSKTVAFALSVLLLAFPAWADEDLRALTAALREQMRQVEALSEQVGKLNGRVAELEAQLARQQRNRNEVRGLPTQAATQSPATVREVPAPPPVTQAEAPRAKPGGSPAAVTAGSMAGSYNIPGTETSFALGGFVKLDAIYSSVSAGNESTANHWLSLNGIPVGADRDGRQGQTALHARESRLWLKTLTPTSLGDLATYVEMDFFDPGNATTANYNPRMRHAYGTLGNLIAGQTWSSFTHIDTYPENLDFSTKFGASFLRTPMLGWIQPFTLDGRRFKWQVSAEMPQTNLITWDGAAWRLRRDDSGHMPDLVTRLTYVPDWGSLSLAGLFRQLRTVDQRSRAHEAWTGGVSLAGKFRTFGLDNLRFNLNAGNAIGRYATGLMMEDALLSTAGELQPITSYTGFVGYQHWWGPAWRSNIVYNYAYADLPGFVPDTHTREGQSLHVNLIWSPLLQTMIGVEYIYALRELDSGASGDLHRVQFSTRFSF